MAKDAVVSEELAKKFATEKDTPYLRWVRGEGLDIIGAHYVPNLQHRRAEAVGAARRRRRLHQPRGLAHLERLLRLRDPAGQEARAAAAAVRGDDPGAVGPRLDHGVERRGQAHHVRVEGGRAVRHPAQLLAPAFQRLRPEPARYVAVTNAPPVINLYEDINFVFNTTHDFKERFAGEPDYFSAKGEQKGFLLQTNFVRGCRQPAADHRQGARRRRRAHPLQHGEGLDEQPHLAVPDRHLQEGPRARSRRARHHPVRRGLLADVAGGRGAAPLRLGGRHADRAAEHVVPPAFQFGHRRRRATSRSSTRASRSGTPRACRRPGSASGWAATRSTMPTNFRRCARSSPTSLPSTALHRAWMRPMRPNFPTCRRSRSRRNANVRSTAKRTQCCFGEDPDQRR